MFDVGCADGSDKGCFSVGHGLTVNDFKQQLLQQIPPLRRYARALTGNLDTADDLVQDCLVRAMQREQKILPGNKPARLVVYSHAQHIHRPGAQQRTETDARAL